MIFQLLPLLCGLASICFSSCITSPRQAAFLLLGFSIGQTIVSWGSDNSFVLVIISPQELAIVAAAAAMLLLRHHEWRRSGLILSGFMAAFWVATLQSMGAPFLLALVLVLIIVGINVWAALYRKGFITDRMIDEALLAVFVLGLFTGLVPEAIGGWQSAGALQALDAGNRGQDLGLEPLLIAVSFTVLGVGWSLWRGRQAR